MGDSERLFDPGPGIYCRDCPWQEPCGAANTEIACAPNRDRGAVGGLEVIHPARPDVRRYLDTVAGPDFLTEVARPIAVPPLPRYLPQLHNRTALRGFLSEPTYAVRGGVVVGTRRQPLTASRLRGLVGLRPEQRLVLLLFDDDRLLERVWDELPLLAPALAVAGYDLIVAPSYSCWFGRARTEHMYNLKRSLRVLTALQGLGAPAIPRIGWVTVHDVERAAEWIDANPGVKAVGVDLATFRTDAGWAAQVEGLDLLDRLTEHRLSYVINGPSEVDRCVALFAAVSPDRVCLTNALNAGPPTTQLGLDKRYERSQDLVLRWREMKRRTELCAGIGASLRAGTGVDLGALRDARSTCVRGPRRRKRSSPRNQATLDAFSVGV